MKKCPYCAEQIQDEAIVCRYCGRDLVEPKKQNKSTYNFILPIVAGLIIATLVLLVELASNPFPNLGNLIFHFVGNALIWSIFVGFLIWVWKFQKGRIIILGVASISILVYLVSIGRDRANLLNFLHTQPESIISTQISIETSPIIEPATTKIPEDIVISTIVPLENRTDLKKLGQQIKESEHFEQWAAQYAGKTLVPKYSFPKVVTGEDYAILSINSNEIDDSYVGEFMTVFGITSGIYQTEELAQLILLSGKYDHFQLRGYQTIFENAYLGICISITGEIQQDETSLFMVTDGARIDAGDECN